MPLDKALARRQIVAVEAAYSRGPHAEFIGKLAGHLKDALDVLDTATLGEQRAQNEVTRLQRDLDEEKNHYRKLREQSASTEQMIALLREISASPKGAQKKAAEQLAKMGAGEVVLVPDKVVVP